MGSWINGKRFEMEIWIFEEKHKFEKWKLA